MIIIIVNNVINKLSRERGEDIRVGSVAKTAKGALAALLLLLRVDIISVMMNNMCYCINVCYCMKYED